MCKFAPKCFKFAPTAFRFCFKFAPNLRTPTSHLASRTYRSPIVHLSFTYRSPIAHLASHPASLTYRSPIVHLSFTYRSPPRDRATRAPVRPPSAAAYPTLLSILVGHTSWGSGPRILACGGRLWVLARWSSEAEEVPDCSRLNWWVISNHQPPVKLRAGPQGTGESSKEWGDSEALPTPPGLCAWAGFSVPSGERNAAQILGSSGNGTLPFFFQLPIPGDPRFHSGRSPGCPQSTESSSALVAREAPT